MLRLSVKVQQWKHRVLCWVSKLYREADVVRTDRDRWRRECVEEGNRLNLSRGTISELKDECGQLKQRLKLSDDTQDALGRQLSSERALRESAESRASQYHNELVLALKHESDWFAVGVAGGHRRPIHGTVVYTPPDDEEDKKANDPIRPKPTARQAAATQTHKTLTDLLADIRAGYTGEADQVGPEFTTNTTN